MTFAELLQITISVLGGLGLFLIGMKNMSEGMLDHAFNIAEVLSGEK